MCKWNNGGIVVDLPDGIAPQRERRTVSIDECIVPQIKALWAKGIQTLGCCCGHGTMGECTLILPSDYDPTELAEAYKILKRRDTRRWSIRKWTLVEVAAVAARVKARKGELMRRIQKVEVKLIGMTGQFVDMVDIPDPNRNMGCTKVYGEFFRIPKHKRLWICISNKAERGHSCHVSVERKRGLKEEGFTLRLSKDNGLTFWAVRNSRMVKLLKRVCRMRIGSERRMHVWFEYE